MSRPLVTAAMLLGLLRGAQAETPNLGRAVTDAELVDWDISVAPDGHNLPPGRGTVAAGEAIYRDRCMSCHGEKGAGKPNDVLVGGKGSLTGGGVPVKTVGSFWPYATTLFDYVRRAMPVNTPKTLNNDEVYAVSAYILALNGIIREDETMDAKTLAAVRMPNRDGFVPFSRTR